MNVQIKAFLGTVDDNSTVYECDADIDLDDEEVNVIDEVCRNFGSDNWDFIEYTVNGATSIFHN